MFDKVLHSSHYSGYWPTLMNKEVVIPAPVVSWKITIHQSVPPSLRGKSEISLSHFVLPAPSRGPITQNIWELLKNNFKITPGYPGEKPVLHGDMQQHYIHRNYEPVAGAQVT